MATITGITRDANGNPLGGVTVKAFNAANDNLAASGTSNATTGAYSLTVPGGVEKYYVNAYLASATFVAGTSRRDLDAAADPIMNLWTGQPTTDGVILTAKLNSAVAANSTRVAVSTSADMSAPTYSAPVVPDSTYRVAKHTITGKAANTEYFYAIEVDGVIDLATKGRFKTLPAAGPASFSIVLGGCTNNTNDATFTAINAMDPKPLFLLSMGDFQYMENANPTLTNYHTAYDTSLGRAVRKVTHSQIPTVYMWDDHDFSIDNATGRDASNAAKSFRSIATGFFRSRIPVKPASNVATDTTHYSMIVGRVRFVLTDLRSDKTAQSATDDAAKTMMGAAQKAWFKAEIIAARDADQVVAWVNSVPWVGVATAGEDGWAGYTTERAELADHIKAAGMQGRVFILSSDMHALAIHTGADYATGGGASIPVFHAGPFNMTASRKGGPYTQGPYPASGTAYAQQYGVMTVTDDGTTLTVNWVGRSSDGTQRVAHSFSPLPVVPAAPETTTPTVFNATGGTITEPGDGYRYWEFKADDNLVVTSAGDVEYLVVAGGGAGSTGNSSSGGAGGAGGLRKGAITIAAGTHAIKVGAGGVGSTAGAGTNGGDSSIGALIAAIGGGHGAYGSGTSVPASSGGSGGGGSGTLVAASNSGGAATSGQGFAGGTGNNTSTQADRSSGGGGGSSSAGGNGSPTAAGNGGAGTAVWGKRYAGGGGGVSQAGAQGVGQDGGGSGSRTAAAGNGTANTGGGGGGACLNMRSGDGGSGIVIIRRPV